MEKEKKTEIIPAFRVTPTQKEEINSLASKSGRSVTELILDKVLEKNNDRDDVIERVLDKYKKKHKASKDVGTKHVYALKIAVLEQIIEDIRVCEKEG